MNKDEPYVEVEAMKMIMAIKSTESGEIRHNLSPGSIISAGDLIASLSLKDPSKVKKISTFTDRLKSVPMKAPLSVDEAAESISLTLDGYPHDFEAAITSYFAGASLECIEKFLATQLNKFVLAEKAFINKEESVVVSEITKSNKDNPIAAVPPLLARKQLKQLEFLP